MEYNTTRSHLTISEYGRNIQKMVEYALTIKDREKRTKVASLIVEVMGQINPQHKEMSNYKHKLWDHIHIISGFKLDVDSPYPAPSPKVLTNKPEKPRYQTKEIPFRYYGNNIKLIIDRAAEYEEGPKKEELIKTIANHLKKSYLTWNREAVDDKVISDHLLFLSKTKLKLSDTTKLNETNDILEMNKRKKVTTSNPPLNKTRKKRY